MKKILIILGVLLTTLSLTPPSVKADVAGPLWTCNMAASASGHSFHIVFGKTTYEGDGNFRCVNILGGDTGNIPIHVAYTVWGLGLGYETIDFVHLLSVGIKVANPDDIFGKYGVANLVGASVLAGGFDVDLVAQLDKDGVGLDLGVKGESVRGIDVNALNFGAVHITSREEK